MGLFNGYLKPGKGVDKNEPKKRGIFLYFDVLIHKFSKLLGANCLLTLTSVLWIVVLYFFFRLVIVNTTLVETAYMRLTAMGALEEGMSADEAYAFLSMFFQSVMAMGVFVLWGSGPSSAAYSYVNRCFTRGEHVWVASDGKDKFVENFKQGMAVVIIDLAALVLSINAILFYWSFYSSTHSFIWLLLTYIMVVALFVYTMMHPYIYQIMVTFECSVTQIYKNAFLLSVAKLPGNVFVTAVSVFFTAFIFSIMTNPLVAALFTGIFGLFITRYPADFYAARVVEKSILKDIRTKQIQTPVIEYLDDEEEGAE